jgi:cell filamentation protein
MIDDTYVYPGTWVLQNKFGILDAEELERIEREQVIQRLSEIVPTGNFDLAHLQAIHHHLFQDVYDWAGKVRTLEIAKGGNQFQPHKYIRTGMEDVHRRILAADYFQNLSPADFVAGAAPIIGDVNYVHPFREGNGRTQLQYLKQLAAKAGHPIDFARLQAAKWLPASQAAHNANYAAMAEAIGAALVRRG